MPKDINEIALRAKGNALNIWTNLFVRRSMLEMAPQFSFITSEGLLGLQEWSSVKMEDDCEVIIDDQVILTGVVDDINLIRSSRRGGSLRISGREVTGDLVDSSYVEEPNEWKNQSILNLIKNLCSPFSISVEHESNVANSVSKKLDTFKANEGDTVFELITRLCNEAQVMPLALGDGKLTLARATTTDQANDAIEYGINAVWTEQSNSNKNRFSDYYVKGYGIGTDNKSLSDYVDNVSGNASDGVITRTRPTLIFYDGASDAGKCRDRAKWQARLNAGFSRTYTYTVKNWVQSNGDVWTINKLVNVIDDFIELNDLFIIVEVDYYLDERGGAVTDLLVVHKDTFSLDDNQIEVRSIFDA